MLAQEVTWRLAGVVRGRATDPYERAVLVEWLAEVTPDEIVAWTDRAERGDWPGDEQGV